MKLGKNDISPSDKNESSYITQYHDILSQLLSQSLKIKYINNKEELLDPFQTEPQRHRDNLITNLLKEYANSFQNKAQEIKCDRLWLKILFSILSGLLILSRVVISLRFVFGGVDNVEQTVSIVASLVTLGVTLLGIVKCIVTYAFPPNDEKYITEIVKLIQENDLKHKQELIKYEINKNREKHKENNEDAK